MRPSTTEPEQRTYRPDGRSAELEAQRVEGERAERQDGEARRASPADAAGGTSWQDIKGQFVDDPAGAIAAAEGLVRQALEHRISALKAEAAALGRAEDDGEREDDSSTEAMRTKLIRYQAYCERPAG